MMFSLITPKNAYSSPNDTSPSIYRRQLLGPPLLPWENRMGRGQTHRETDFATTRPNRPSGPHLRGLWQYLPCAESRPGNRVYKCHRLTVVRRCQISLTLRNILRFASASWKIHDFINFFFTLLSIFSLFMSMFRDFLAIFLTKFFKIKIVTAQKKHQLLECLPGTWKDFPWASMDLEAGSRKKAAPRVERF